MVVGFPSTALYRSLRQIKRWILGLPAWGGATESIAMTTTELLDRAIPTLICALAFDEALQSGASDEDIAELRGHWVSDAEAIVDEAEELGLMGDD